MKVFTEDISRLFNKALVHFEEKKGFKMNTGNMAEFFKQFTVYINEQTKSNLSEYTIYKQYYIRLKNYTHPEIGFSLNYLNAFCQLVNRTDYTQEFSVASQDEDSIPEFPYPPYIPCFPASPALRIKIEGAENYNNIWIKDESINPTGTHKDRLAWEIYLFYNSYIKEQLESGGKVNIPRLSLISSGNAALSIQYLLRLNGLPNLKVIVDENIDKDFLQVIKKSGCEVYPRDLKKILSSEDILNITENKTGFDLTYGDRIENIKLTFYDWLSYEVLNLNPQHLFIPYGSGDLFKNVLEICLDELKGKRPSKRFFGTKSILSKCNFFGACTSNKKTRMRMLYAPHNSFKDHDLKNVFEGGAIGHYSNTYDIDEKYVEPAMKIAKQNGIICEESGVAGLALFLQVKNDFADILKPTDKIVIVNTGKVKRELFESTNLINE
jgi:hypothetical protein